MTIIVRRKLNRDKRDPIVVRIEEEIKFMVEENSESPVTTFLMIGVLIILVGII